MKIGNKALLRLMTAILFLVYGCMSWATESAGQVLKVSGEASLKDSQGQMRSAESKEKVYAGDTVITGKGGQVFLVLNDKTRMIVRQNSMVVIEAFKYENKSSDLQSTSVLQGALRSVSGAISKSAPKNVNYKVGTATIGIRGTDIDLAIIGDGEPDRAGIYNYVRDGQTEVTLASGENAIIEKEKSGFIPSKPEPGEALLQVLNDRPAFLRSSGFDTLMNQLRTPRVPTMR
jgi:hypothetical protein